MILLLVLGMLDVLVVLKEPVVFVSCLVYPSDAADELPLADPRGRRINK